MNENTPMNGQQAPQPAHNPNNMNEQPYNFYYNSQALYNTGYAQYQAKPKEETVFSKPEKIFAFAAAGLSFLFVHFVLWHTPGFFTTAFYLLLFTAVSVYLKKTGHSFKSSHKVWLITLMVFSTVFSITANSFIKVLDVIFLMLGGAYLVYCVTSDRTMFGRFMPYEFIKCTLENPFTHFGKEYSAVNSSVKSSKTGTNFKAVFLGLIVAVPLTVVVGALLMSADRGVEEMLSSLTSMLNISNVFSLIYQLAVTLPVSGYLFGLLYSHTHPEKISALDDDECTKKIKNMRKITNIAVYSAVTPICILYILFFISQANYFLSAFNNTLPENYSYAEYARRGFFELFAIMLINAGVILFINLFSKKTGEEKPAALRSYTIVISVFTLLITATAISKMVMYIDNYGLTQLRVYTTWFMILTAILFVYVIIRQFSKNFPFMRAAAVTFTLMFTVLCFSRPDAVIARYNMENCTDTMTYRDIEEMNALSSDASAVITEHKYRTVINKKYLEISHYRDDYNDTLKSGYEVICERAERDLDQSPYYDYNISALTVRANLG